MYLLCLITLYVDVVSTNTLFYVNDSLHDLGGCSRPLKSQSYTKTVSEVTWGRKLKIQVCALLQRSENNWKLLEKGGLTTIFFSCLGGIHVSFFLVRDLTEVKLNEAQRPLLPENFWVGMHGWTIHKLQWMSSTESKLFKNYTSKSSKVFSYFPGYYNLK